MIFSAPPVGQEDQNRICIVYFVFFQHHQLTKLREAINEKYGEDLQDYHQVGIVIAGTIEVFDKDKCGDNRKIKEINKQMIDLYSSSTPGLFRTMASFGKR